MNNKPSPTPNVSIELGAMGDPLNTQFNLVGIKYDPEGLAHLERDKQAIARLLVRGIIAHSEAPRLYKRLLKKVQEHIYKYN